MKVFPAQVVNSVLCQTMVNKLNARLLYQLIHVRPILVRMVVLAPVIPEALNALVHQGTLGMTVV